MPIVIWRFTDAKPGHDHQSQGLLQALAERVPVSVFNVAVNRAGSGFWSWLSRGYRPGARLPLPDLLLGAGHATHWHLLAARRRWGGRIIVLMKPSLPISRFDLCLIPEHDSPPKAVNVLSTVGVLNRIQTSFDHNADTGLIILGGPSRHFQWDNDQLLHQVEILIKRRPLRKWWLTTSRRTPQALVEQLVNRPDIDCYPFACTAQDWLPARLAEAGEVWVSEDSVSMIYEALTSGARVGLLKVPRQKPDRITSGVDSLVGKGWVGEPGNWELAPGPDRPVNEAARCAGWIEREWLTNH